MAKILLLDNYRQTLTVIRSLAARGHQIVLGKDTDAKLFTECSRYVNAVWTHPAIETRENDFLAALADYLDKNRDIEFVFPIGEFSLSCLARNASHVKPEKLVMPDSETLLTCLDKGRLLKVVAGLNIPLLQTAVVHDLAELQAIAAETEFPIVIKPTDSLKYFGGRKIVTCANMEELNAQFPQWPAGHATLIVQKLAPGRRHNCYFAASHGKVFAYFENIILRTDRLDDSGYYVEGASVLPTPELERYCEILVEALGYHGIGCVQFMHDPKSNETHFLELNPRLGANGAFPFRSGVDFPFYAMLCRQNADVSAWMRKEYPTNRSMHWLMGDIKGLIFTMGSEDRSTAVLLRWISRMIGALVRSNYHLTWSWKDPLPTLFIYGQFLKTTVGSVYRKMIPHRLPAAR